MEGGISGQVLSPYPTLYPLPSTLTYPPSSVWFLEDQPNAKLRRARVIGDDRLQEIGRVARARGIAEIRVVRQVVDLQEKACLVARKPTGVLKSAVENRLVLTVDPIPNG